MPSHVLRLKVLIRLKNSYEGRFKLNLCKTDVDSKAMRGLR